MEQKMYKTDRSRRAFSLVEILFAVIIIGVLTAVAIPSLFSQKGKADDSNAKQSLRAALTLIQSSTDESQQLQGVTATPPSGVSDLVNFLKTQDKNFTWAEGVKSSNDGNVRAISIVLHTSEIVKLAAIGGKNSTGQYNCFGISYDVSGFNATVFSKKDSAIGGCIASDANTPNTAATGSTTEKTGDFPLK